MSLKLSIWVRDKGSEIRNGTLVNNSLSELLSVLSDLAKSGGGNSLESKFWLLNTENKKTDGTSINNGLSQLMSVLSDASKSPGSSLLD